MHALLIVGVLYPSCAQTLGYRRASCHLAAYLYSQGLGISDVCAKMILGRGRVKEVDY